MSWHAALPGQRLRKRSTPESGCTAPDGPAGTSRPHYPHGLLISGIYSTPSPLDDPTCRPCPAPITSSRAVLEAAKNGISAASTKSEFSLLAVMSLSILKSRSYDLWPHRAFHQIAAQGQRAGGARSPWASGFCAGVQYPHSSALRPPPAGPGNSRSFCNVCCSICTASAAEMADSARSGWVF